MCSVVVCDVSFITYAYNSAVNEIIAPADICCADKAQFELDRDSIGSSGVVTLRARADAVCRVISAAAAHGLCALALMVSPVTGGAVENERERRRGNVEYIALFKRPIKKHLPLLRRQI